jgi:hypothetical protein
LGDFNHHYQENVKHDVIKESKQKRTYIYINIRGLEKNSIGDRNNQIKQKNALTRENASPALKHILQQKKRNNYWKNEIFHTKNAFEESNRTYSS